MASNRAGRRLPPAVEETVDVPRNAAESGEARGVQLVQGCGPELSEETRQLLQGRLRVAAWMLCFGFLAYCVWEGLARQSDLRTWGALVTMTAILGGLAAALRRPCRLSVWLLRGQEALTFGLPALLFSWLMTREMVHSAVTVGVLPTPFEPWLLLIFTYAMFIPNTWRRAVTVIATLSLMPVVVTLLTLITEPACRAAVNGDVWYLSSMTLMMAIAATFSLIGFRLMGTLRAEVFQARRLGQYRLKQLIGTGGFGEVYLAEHRMMKRPCAIKIIRPDKSGNPRLVARFEREVQAIAQLSHWNTVEIFDYGRTDDGTFYYVMEYLPGQSLQQLVDAWGPLESGRAIYLLRQACDALREAHSLGLVHRDLKPANIFCAQRGGHHDVVKLLDFGLAKPVSEDEATTTGSANISGEASITGSPLYLAPEQATGDMEPDARSDVYSLGAVAFFLVTGRPPFVSERALRVILAHVHQQPPHPQQFVPLLSDDLAEVILKCLAKDPAERYQSAEELAEALDQCADAQEWSIRDADRWWREHHGLPSATGWSTTLAS